MPVRGSVLSPTEVLLAREACEPLLASITDRLLRSGLAGFAGFRRRFALECQRAMSTAGAKKKNLNTPLAPTASSSSSAAAPARANRSATTPTEEGASRVARRINPEGLKGVFAQAGVLFSSDEFKSILVAFSDPVGFVLAEDLLAALHPCRRAPLSVIRSATAAVAESLFADLPMSTGTSGEKTQNEDFAAVAVDSVCDAFRSVFDPALTEAEVAAQEEVEASSTAACAAALASLHADVEATFTDTIYPEGAVPAEDVVAFVVLALQQHAVVSSILFARLRDATPLTAAPSPSVAGLRAATTAGGASAFDGSKLFSIHHTGVTTQRKFEYYGDNVDRRDEWVRGRRESDARPAYQRHAVGYGGHLPEYQYRFGRTFHVIEEDLPQLTKPKPPLEPIPADWYGEGVELKDSRMNAHHYRLA